jgi:hypothetical protein
MGWNHDVLLAAQLPSPLDWHPDLGPVAPLVVTALAFGFAALGLSYLLSRSDTLEHYRWKAAGVVAALGGLAVFVMVIDHMVRAAAHALGIGVGGVLVLLLIGLFLVYGQTDHGG